jgi:hypothetical protein
MTTRIYLRCFSVLTVLAATGFAVTPATSSAQSARSIEGASGGVYVGGDLDNYLRYLESLGKTPVLPWGLRGFSPSVVDSLTSVRGKHPWADSWLFAKQNAPAHFRVLPVEVTERYNSSYPYGINEGPVWAGRGLTSSVSAGFTFAAGPLTAVVKPIVFRAENQGFVLRPTGYPGNGRFADPLWPLEIDRPQRFGSRAYSHFDLGETTLRIDLLGVSLGATTANEWWGPSTVFPYLVGNNAAGVPRIFLGTQSPTNIYIGTLQARVEYGLEAQSGFSPVSGPNTYTSPDSSGRTRLMSGLVVTFSPKIFPGLEIDGARYFHDAWTGHFDAAALRTPFEGLLKQSIPRGISIPGIDDRDVLKNQLASVSIRWVLPHSGVDIYGEYGREDHAENTRALEAEPDLTRTAMAGFRKAFQHADSSSFDAVRAEVFDGDPTTMGLHRPEGRTYIHFPIRQGNTEEGKVIGAGVGIGAPSAATLAWDRYRSDGRTSFYLMKMSQNTPTNLASDPQTTAVAGASALRFTRFGNATFDLAAVRTNRVLSGWGGWNLSASVGAVAPIP